MMEGHLGDPAGQKKSESDEESCISNVILCIWNVLKPMKVENLLEVQGVREVQGIPNEEEKHTGWMSFCAVNQSSVHNETEIIYNSK